MESSEGFHQMLHLNDVFVGVVDVFFSLDTRRVKDVGKLGEDDIGRVDVLHPTLVEKRHALTAANFVKVGGGGDNGDAALLESSEHFPELFAAHRVDTCGGLVKEKDAGRVYQGATQCQLLLHASRQCPRAAVLEPLYL